MAPDGDLRTLLRRYNEFLTGELASLPIVFLARAYIGEGLPRAPVVVVRPIVSRFAAYRVATALDALTKCYACRVALDDDASAVESLGAVESYAKAIDRPGLRRWMIAFLVASLGLAYVLASRVLGDTEDGGVLRQLMASSFTLDTSALANVLEAIDLERALGVFFIILGAASSVLLVPTMSHVYLRRLWRCDSVGSVDAAESKVFKSLGRKAPVEAPFELALLTVLAFVPVWIVSVLVYFGIASRRGLVANVSTWRGLAPYMAVAGLAAVVGVIRVGRIAELSTLRNGRDPTNRRGVLGRPWLVRTQVGIVGIGLVVVFVASENVRQPFAPTFAITHVQVHEYMTLSDYLKKYGRPHSDLHGAEPSDLGVVFSAKVTLRAYGDVSTRWALRDDYTHKVFATLQGPTFSPKGGVSAGSDHKLTAGGLILVDFVELHRSRSPTGAYGVGTSRVWAPIHLVADHPLEAELELLAGGRVTRAAGARWSPIVD